MRPKQTATNGEHWRDGQLYVWCGNTAIPIHKRDAQGNDVKPPVPDDAPDTEQEDNKNQ